MEFVSTPSSRKQKLGKEGGGNNNELYYGMLRQVSEMTMDESRVYSTPGFQNTPRASTAGPGLGSIFETPDHILSTRLYTTPKPLGRSLVVPSMETDPAHESKRKPSPMLVGGKKVRSSNSVPHALPSTDSRVFNAPPLPSSPELSVGVRNRQALPPQFSPIASIQMLVPPNNGTIPPPPTRTTSPEDSPGMVTHTASLVHRATNPSAEAEAAPPAPPSMPWMDTPEQVGGKRIVSMNQLKMRKRNNPIEELGSPWPRINS